MGKIMKVMLSRPVRGGLILLHLVHEENIYIHFHRIEPLFHFIRDEVVLV